MTGRLGSNLSAGSKWLSVRYFLESRPGCASQQEARSGQNETSRVIKKVGVKPEYSRSGGQSGTYIQSPRLVEADQSQAPLELPPPIFGQLLL